MTQFRIPGPLCPDPFELPPRTPGPLGINDCSTPFFNSCSTVALPSSDEYPDSLLLGATAGPLGVNDLAETQADSAGGSAGGFKMTVSNDGLDFIERHEGYRDHVYRDSAGFATIGYGHLIKKGEDFGDGITEEQGAELLKQDVQEAVDAVGSKLKIAVTQTEFDALVDFTFNLGAANFGKSTLLKNINAGKSVTRKNFTDWNHAGGKVVQGLTIRRTDEFNLFTSGNYGRPAAAAGAAASGKARP